MQLLDLFTVAGADGDDFNTTWLRFSPDYGRAEFWVDCKMFTGASVNVKLVSSMDTDETNEKAVSNVAVSATGATINQITSELGAFVRLNMTISGGTTHAVVSVWLLPKRA